jgi:hypothetical protein
MIDNGNDDWDRKQEIEAVDLGGRREESDRIRLGVPDDHWHLHAVCIRLPTDYEPYGFRVRTGPDCASGCRWFLKLEARPYDWGVCSNPQSPRCGLLTFEHQGCAFFEAAPTTDGEPGKTK